MGDDIKYSKLLVDNEYSPESRIMKFDDDKSETLVVFEGDFKKVKNFDPVDFWGEDEFGKSDKIILAAGKDQTAYSFKDKESGYTYAFITDKNDKIVAGIIVEYSGKQNADGIKIPKQELNLLSLNPSKTDWVNAEQYNGDTKDKEEIKEFIKSKVKDNTNGLEVTQNVSKKEALEAVNGLASADVKTGNSFKSSGGATEKGSNSIG